MLMQDLIVWRDFLGSGSLTDRSSFLHKKGYVKIELPLLETMYYLGITNDYQY